MKQECLTTALAVQMVAWLAIAGHAETNGPGVSSSVAPSNGESRGEWLVDYQAARALAREKDLPILLNFSGTEWCPPCIQMATNVFCAPEWKAFAAEKVIPVLVDMPKDPGELSGERRELAARFGVQGVPVCFVLDSDGTNVLGQAGFQPELFAFIRDIGAILRKRGKEQDAFLRSLTQEDRDRYVRLTGEKAKAIRDLEEWMATAPKATEENRRTLGGYESSIGDAEKTLQEIEVGRGLLAFSGPNAERVAKMRGTAGAYVDATKEVEAARAALDNWLLGRPRHDDRNARTYAALRERLDAALRRVRAVQ